MPRDTFLKLIIDNSSGVVAKIANAQAPGQKTVGKNNASLKRETSNGDSISDRNPIALPFVDRLTIDLLARQPFQRPRYFGPSPKRFNQFRMVIHNENILGNRFRLVKGIFPDKLKKRKDKHSQMIRKDTRPSSYIDLSRRLRVTRIILGFETGRAFAEHLKVQEDRLSKWENGYSQIPTHYALKLKAQFGVTLDWLYDGDPIGLPVEIFRKLEWFITHEALAKEGKTVNHDD